MLRHSAYISDDLKKKSTNFLFLIKPIFFYLSLSGGWTQKVGGTNDSPSPPLKKVGGTISPVSSPSYAHEYRSSPWSPSEARELDLHAYHKSFYSGLREDNTTLISIYKENTCAQLQDFLSHSVSYVSLRPCLPSMTAVKFGRELQTGFDVPLITLEMGKGKRGDAS